MAGNQTTLTPSDGRELDSQPGSQAAKQQGSRQQAAGSRGSQAASKPSSRSALEEKRTSAAGKQDDLKLRIQILQNNSPGPLTNTIGRGSSYSSFWR